MTRLKDVVAASKRPTTRHWSRLIILLLGCLMVWAYFAELDEVAVAQGEVVPQGQVRTIQHLEGGIIEQILVREGDPVTAGDPVIRLDLLSGDATREELAVRLDGFVLMAARLRAQSNGEVPEYDEAVAERRPDLVRLEQNRFSAFQRELEATQSVLMERINQRELEAKQLRSRRQALRRDLELAREEFAVSTELLVDGLTSKVDHLRLQRDVESLEGELAELADALPRAEAAISEARKEAESETLRFRRRSGEELGKVELDIAQIREALARASDRVRRLEIQAPIDGIVKDMRYHTIGGVVSPGEAIMDIVPTSDNLVIEARLNPADVGYVRVGQPALAKITTYDYMRYGGLPGEVIDISPDSHTDSEGNPYFRLVMRTDKNYLGDQEGDFPISAGMQASVDIQTGTKSVLRYLLTPVLKLRYEAFRER